METSRTASRVATAALLAAAAFPGCGRAGPGAPGEGDGGPEAAPPRLALVVEAGRAATVRAGSEVVLRFNRPLDPSTVRGAVRVEDGTRGRALVPVLARARGRELVLRSPDAAGWRPGAVLSVRVAGLPSLRALRAADGAPLEDEAALEVSVRPARRTDREGPALLGSDPPDGAEGTDPAAPLVLRFSEPMEARSLTLGSAGPRRDPLRLSADGVPVPYRCFLDRTRHDLTVMPTEPLPPGAAVALELTTRVRDASGNPLDPASPRIVSFTTAAAGPSGAGRIVEAFEDREGLDPLGTTVRWNDPAEPGVLSGVLEPVALESGVPSDTAVVLDPRGGSFRILVPAAELGDEPRVLRALHLLAAPGPLPGEVLEPAVRLAAVPRGLTAVPSEAPAAWVPVTEELRGAAPRGADGAILLPFRHPFVHDGSSALLVEFTWAGVAGNVILLAARAPEPRTLAWGSDPGPVSLRLSPALRAEAMGERATARSRWLDAGVPLPSWQEPRARPHPDPARTRVELQGAPPAADGRGPDEARATRWSADPLVLEGSRWVRFRVHFEPAPQGEAAPHLDDLTIPFVGR